MMFNKTNRVTIRLFCFGLLFQVEILINNLLRNIILVILIYDCVTHQDSPDR